MATVTLSVTKGDYLLTQTMNLMNSVTKLNFFGSLDLKKVDAYFGKCVCFLVDS